jgi:hypothetical protein
MLLLVIDQADRIYCLLNTIHPQLVRPANVLTHDETDLVRRIPVLIVDGEGFPIVRDAGIQP